MKRIGLYGLLIAFVVCAFAAAAFPAQVTKALDTFVGNIKLLDNKTLILGTDSDTTLQYDEATTDRTLLTTAAGSGLNVLTGNLYVGNGTPGTATINGEDLYVEGVSEFDGLIAADGGVKIPDDVALTLGTDSDVTITYDETTDDQGEFSGPWGFTDPSTTIAFYGGWAIGDDKPGTFGNDGDVILKYDETTDDRFEITSAATDFSGTVTSSATGTIGWSIVAGANTACTITCTSACVMGFDDGAADAETVVDCADAAADKCLCAGAS